MRLSPADLVSTIHAACAALYARLNEEQRVFVVTLQYATRKEEAAAKARHKTRRMNLDALAVLMPLLTHRKAELIEAIKAVLTPPSKRPQRPGHEGVQDEK